MFFKRDKNKKKRPKPRVAYQTIPFQVKFFVINYLVLLLLLFILFASLILGKFTLMDMLWLVPLNVTGLLACGLYLLTYKREVMSMEEIFRKRLIRTIRAVIKKVRA